MPQDYFDAMKTLRDISSTLRSSAVERGMKQAELKDAAGVSQRTLTNVFSGTEDFKVSTLLALADRVGLELILVPKAAAVAVEAGQTAAPRVKSRVAAALERLQPSGESSPAARVLKRQAELARYRRRTGSE